MTGTDTLLQRTTAAAASASLQQQQQQQHHGSASSLAQQIHLFNRQQFAGDKAKSSSDVDAILLTADSDDDDDNDDEDEQQQRQRHDSSNGTQNALETTATLSVSEYESEDEVDDEEEAAFAMMSTLQLLQSRSVRTPSRDATPRASASASVSASMEIKHAEERIAALEAQLLDAEETICHLKAEKLAARRDVERLSLALAAQATRASDSNSNSTAVTAAAPVSRVNIWTTPPPSGSDASSDSEATPETHSEYSGDSDTAVVSGRERRATRRRQRAEAQALEERAAAERESQMLEHEELRAVIREQECEIQKLKLALERMSETCEDLDARLFEAFELTSPPVRRCSSIQQQQQLNGVHDDRYSSDDDDDDTDAVVSRRRHRSVKTQCRTSSLDSRASSASDGSGGTEPSSSGALSADQHSVTAPPTPAPTHWTEELVRHPTPHFDLDSPEVHYLLASWTANTQKLQYLRLWFAQVASVRAPLAADVPHGVELPRLLPEIRDAFLTLVVPLLRKQTQRDVVVHSRLCSDQYHADLRIRVEPRS